MRFAGALRYGIFSRRRMMKRSMIGKAVFSAAVALALGFGAHEAVAAPGEQMQARRPYCSDQEDCQNTCELMYPGYTGFGYCSAGNTCYC
jgi:uncharacterized membrane protein